METYKTVFKDCLGEYEEKRSRFIAHMRHVETPEQATEFINSVKAQNREARHNVYAYILRENNLSRFSDDGEPHGTAGKPVYDVIRGMELTDVCIVVTRYFGGILLGTGGLCHAYSTASKDCAENADIKTMGLCLSFETVCSYQQYNRLLPLIEKNGGVVTDTVFSDSVTVSYTFSHEKCGIFLEQLTENFASALTATKKGEKFSQI